MIANAWIGVHADRLFNNLESLVILVLQAEEALLCKLPLLAYTLLLSAIVSFSLTMVCAYSIKALAVESLWSLIGNALLFAINWTLECDTLLVILNLLQANLCLDKLIFDTLVGLDFSVLEALASQI